MSHPVTTLITTDKAVANNQSRLSICLRPNGFSFSVSTLNGELLTVGDCQTELPAVATDLVRMIVAAIGSGDETALDYNQMQLVVPSPHFVWVPEHLFEPVRDRQYLELVCESEPSANVCRIYSPLLKSFMVFEADADLVTAFKILMPGIDIHCQHSVLVNDILLGRSESHPLMLLHVREGVGDFEAFYNGNLLLSASHPATSDEDHLYQAINIMKRLHLETPDMELAICGQVDRTFYSRLQHFFPNVTLYTGRPFTFTNPEFQTLHTYRHTLILS